MITMRRHLSPTTSTNRCRWFRKHSETVVHPISSSNREAQAYFNQGIKLMYALDEVDAVR